MIRQPFGIVAFRLESPPLDHHKVNSPMFKYLPGLNIRGPKKAKEYGPLKARSEIFKKRRIAIIDIDKTGNTDSVKIIKIGGL